MASGRVLVVGSLNADLVVRTARIPGPGETVAGSDLVIVPGGKSSNQAAAVGKLGGDVAMLGCVGDDGNGAMLVKSLEDAGVDVSQVRALEGVSTGSAMIAVDDAGENCIIVSPGANGRLSADDVNAAADFFATADSSSVLTLCLEVSLDAVKAAARNARERGAKVVLNISPYMKVGADLLDLVDILLVNNHELADLTGQAEFDPLGDWTSVIEATNAALGASGPRTVVVTLGAQGARIIDLDAGTASQQIPSPKVKPVDTTGCGDAFLAAFSFRIAAGDDLEQAAAFAVRVGAYAATGEGAQNSYPTAEQLASWTP
ncbi:ribokinase [Micropruina sp.]|uniref:ribokinase n=1 Tax=Micropruina sp. TaxID=2737536 RepID=UPI0026068277|nr:ribokinase [Micropruina sp.]